MPRQARLAHHSRGSSHTEVEVLLYTSSMHANREAVALYERTRDALPERPMANVPLSHPGPEPDLERFAEELGYDLLIGPGTVELLRCQLCNTLGVSKLRMAGLLGAARLGFGLALLVFPAPTLRFFYPTDDASRRVSLELGRALGIREVALGLGILGSLMRDKSPQSWLLASAAVDTVDVTLTLTKALAFSRRGRLVTYAAVPLTIPLEYYLALKLDE